MKNIILLNGDIGVGKTFLANIFETNGYVRESYAHTLKMVSYSVMKEYFHDVTPNLIYGNYNDKKTPLHAKNSSSSLMALLYFEDWLMSQTIYPCTPTQIIKCKLKLFKKLSQKNITPREIMQYIGCDIMRDIIHKDFHVMDLMQRIEKSTHNDFVIDDYRFPNEYNALKKTNNVFGVCVDKLSDNKSTHISENQTLPVDYVINLGYDDLLEHKHYNEIVGEYVERKRR